MPMNCKLLSISDLSLHRWQAAGEPRVRAFQHYPAIKDTRPWVRDESGPFQAGGERAAITRRAYSMVPRASCVTSGS
jgi:hypothetical protein